MDELTNLVLRESMNDIIAHPPKVSCTSLSLNLFLTAFYEVSKSFLNVASLMVVWVVSGLKGTGCS